MEKIDLEVYGIIKYCDYKGLAWQKYINKNLKIGDFNI